MVACFIDTHKRERRTESFIRCCAIVLASDVSVTEDADSTRDGMEAARSTKPC